jgi:chromosome segregation ATPase
LNADAEKERENRKLEEQVQELTKSNESLNEQLFKTRKEDELRREAIKAVHSAIQDKEKENQDLRQEKSSLEKKIAEYLAQNHVFDVYKTGIFKSLAKVRGFVPCDSHKNIWE